MKKAEVFANIKEANKIVDEMKQYRTDSKEYSILSDSLYWLLETMITCKWFTLHVSNRTGHYYVTF